MIDVIYELAYTSFLITLINSDPIFTNINEVSESKMIFYPSTPIGPQERLKKKELIHHYTWRQEGKGKIISRNGQMQWKVWKDTSKKRTTCIPI